MRVERLQIQNFRSYADADLDLSTVSLASIVGPNGAGKSSLLEALVFALTGGKGLRNLDAFVRQGTEECRVSLTFSMAGETYRLTRTRSTRGSGKSTVELCHQVEDLWAAEGSGARDTDERIRQILGVDEETLLGTAFVAQGDAGSFFALPPAKRLEALGSILKLDEVFGPLERHFKGAAEEAKASLEASRRDVERLELDVERLGEREYDFGKAIDDRDFQSVEVRRADDALNAAQAEAEAAQAALTFLDVTRAKRDELRARKAELEQRLHTLNMERVNLDGRIAEKAALQARLATKGDLEAEIASLEQEREGDRALEGDRRRMTEALATARETVDQARTDWEAAARQKKTREAMLADARMKQERVTMDAAKIEAKIRVIEAAEQPVCDRCGQSIESAALAQTLEGLRDELDNVRETILDAEAAIEQAQRMVTDAGLDMENLLTRGHAAREDFDARQAELESLPAPTFDEVKHAAVGLGLSPLATIPAQLATIATHEERLGAILADLAKLDDELESDDCRSALAKAEQAVSEGESLLEAARLAKGRVEMTQAVLDGERGKLSQAERYAAHIEGEVATLEPSRARLKETRAQAKGLEVEQADAELLRRAMGKWGIPALIVANVLRALEVHVNELLELYDGGFAIRFESKKETNAGSRDSMEIVCFDGAAWRPLETYSGGEQYRFASAMRLGLALLLAHRSGARVESLIVDEPEGLDVAGRQNLVRILERMSDSFGIVLLATHYVDLQDAFPSQILVSRGEDGLSRAEVVA